MTALKVVQAEIVDGLDFYEIDKQITEVIRDFVQLGELLIKMRDGQHYRKGGYTTFEDYCKSKAGLSIKWARETIRYGMAYKAIVDSSGGTKVPPETIAQVRALLPIANFATEKRKVETTDGVERTVEQTVGIKNPTKVAAQWEKTVKEFDRLKAKADKEGTRPPTLSGKFVRNLLPNELKVSPGRGFDCNPLVRLTGRLDVLVEWMEQNGCLKKDRLSKLANAEPPCHVAQIGLLMDAANEAVVAINRMSDLLEEMKNVN